VRRVRFARVVWTRIETIHAVTYFAAESRAMAREVGLKGFWMGYFGFRAAPFGEAPAALVEATFYNFAPSMVTRSVPDAWMYASPYALVEARTVSAASALRNAMVAADTAAARLLERLDVAVRHGSAAGRPLFAVNRCLAPRRDPVEQLWQLCTAIREHRGDGHVAALTSAGIDGCEAHVLIAGQNGHLGTLLQETRGWTSDEWSAAGARLMERGLLSAPGVLSDSGRRLRDDIEESTDRLAEELFAGFDRVARRRLVDDLDLVAGAVVDAAVIPFPNPMGLPKLDE
jgi:hypothetical protein